MSYRAIEVAVLLKCPGESSRNFVAETGLRKLRERGALDNQVVDWGIEISNIYHEATHSLRKVSAEDAQDVFKFAKRLVDYLYVLPSDMTDFTKRRQARSQPNE